MASAALVSMLFIQDTNRRQFLLEERNQLLKVVTVEDHVLQDSRVSQRTDSAFHISRPQVCLAV